MIKLNFNSLKNKNNKMGKNIRKSIHKVYKSNNKTKKLIYIAGNGTRKSSRISGKKNISIKELGNSNRAVTENEIKRFVKNEIIENVPIIVSLPVPPERHSFLVHVKKDDNKIMISDWGGKNNKHRGDEYDSWKNYSNFMKMLEEKYDLPVKYYNIDAELKKKAIIHHERHNDSGGCSEYIFKWAKKHYPEY
jgi:hypothetical protein